jgi:hypothetical protein
MRRTASLMLGRTDRQNLVDAFGEFTNQIAMLLQLGIGLGFVGIETSGRRILRGLKLIVLRGTWIGEEVAHRQPLVAALSLARIAAVIA